MLEIMPFRYLEVSFNLEQPSLPPTATNLIVCIYHYFNHVFQLENVNGQFTLFLEFSIISDLSETIIYPSINSTDIS